MSARAILGAGAIALAAAGGVSCGPPECADRGDAALSVFIAFDCDVADFRQWERFSLGDAPLQGHPAGARFAYLNHRPPAGATEFPVGTVIVKAIENPPDAPQQWDVFAMAKRGGGYNADGAAGWEFFRLRVLADGRAVINTRGLSPGDGTGGGYGGVVGTGGGCNGCHGTAEARAHDAVLSAPLQLDALAR